MTAVEAVEPKLRFDEFDDSWEEKSLGEVCNKIQDGNYGFDYPKSHEFLSNGVPFLTSKALGGDGEIINSKIDYISQEKHSSLKKAQIKPADILFTNRGSNVGAIGEVGDFIVEGNIGPQLTLLRANREIILPKFLKYCMKTPVLNKQVRSQDSGSAMNFFGIKATSKFKLCIPSLIEQQKIADFLSAVDQKISLLKEKHAILEQYKKGVMQKLFKQELRFKDDSGNDFPDWQSRRFEEVFVRITRKNKEDNQNVLTISAQMGLVNQEKYFNKSVSAKDLTGYYLLENGDFAYNKSYSKGYPMGAIKRLNNYDKGVVSTLYICFRVVGEQEPLFWEQFFEAGQLNREINKIAQEGARNHGLLNVSVTEFFSDIEVPVPSRVEQRKIADFLRVLDQKLNAVKEQIELTQTFKKGLLQQMFV